MCFSQGQEDFDKRWNRLHDNEAALCAFDLLQLDGEDLRELPLGDRKVRLAKLLKKNRPGLEFVEHLEGDGPMI